MQVSKKLRAPSLLQNMAGNNAKYMEFCSSLQGPIVHCAVIYIGIFKMSHVHKAQDVT